MGTGNGSAGAANPARMETRQPQAGRSGHGQHPSAEGWIARRATDHRDASQRQDGRRSRRTEYSGIALEDGAMNRRILAAVSILGAAAFTAPAIAHHSFAMFDQEKTITLKGTVKEFEWNNPHVWMRITVMDQATGKPLQYAMEMGSVARSTYDGWKRDTVKPGDAVTVNIHP